MLTDNIIGPKIQTVFWLVETFSRQNKERVNQLITGVRWDGGGGQDRAVTERFGIVCDDDDSDD